MKTDPVARAPRPPGRRESHWGTLAALGQVSPHWGRLLTCPNDPLPTPNAPLPTPNALPPSIIVRLSVPMRVFTPP